MLCGCWRSRGPPLIQMFFCCRERTPPRPQGQRPEPENRGVSLPTMKYKPYPHTNFFNYIHKTEGSGPWFWLSQSCRKTLNTRLCQHIYSLLVLLSHPKYAYLCLVWNHVPLLRKNNWDFNKLSHFMFLFVYVVESYLVDRYRLSNLHLYQL